MVASESLFHRYRNTQDWYDQGFVEGFIALVQHDAHIVQPRFKTEDNKIMMVLVSAPNEDVHEENLWSYGDATHFLSSVYASSHFAVLYYDILEATVTVFDGLNMDIKKWEMHIVHTLKIYGLKPLDATWEALVTTTSTKKRNGRPKIGRVMELRFKSKDKNGEQLGQDWIVTNDPSISQSDGYNCGPIACTKVMEVFGIIEPDSMSTIAESPGGYRTVVMDYYKGFISRHKNEIFLELRKKNMTSMPTSSEGDEKGDEGDDHTNVARSVAMEKRNKRQAASAEKEMKRCGDKAIRNGAAPGAVVTLKVD